jgi:hypothetical protein
MIKCVHPVAGALAIRRQRGTLSNQSSEPRVDRGLFAAQ